MKKKGEKNVERNTNILYVKNVIHPLEKLVKKMREFGYLSKEERHQLDQLLLDKYLMLECILREEMTKISNPPEL